MAIEDEKYNAVVEAIQAFMKTGRNGFVKSQLIRLAIQLLWHYGYEVTEAPAIDPSALPKEN